VIDEITEDLEYLEDGEELDEYCFEEGIIKAFGGSKSGIELINRELQKLLKAHQSEKFYMPNDRHFQLLHRVLSSYCDIYNDTFGLFTDEDGGDDSSIHRDIKGDVIEELDIDMIIEYFFWDMDFDLPIETAIVMKNSVNKTIQKMGDFSNVAINASCNAPVDGEDLLLAEAGGAIEAADEDIPWNAPEDTEDD
jgi:hypothetical protein